LNSRTSQTQLSKKVGLSKNAVKYRIDRLRKEGVIINFASVVNLGTMDITTVTLLLKFNEDIYEKKEFIDYFKNHPFADWVVTLSGQWDMFVELASKDFNHLNKIISDIVGRFGKSLNTYQLFFSNDTLRVEHLIADFYKDLKVEQPSQKERVTKVQDVDETDRRILHVLNEDSSLPYLQIAQKLGLTIDIVRYRMKNLIKKGVLVKFFAEISLPKLGYTEYLYTLKLKSMSKEQMQKIKSRIQKNNNITYAFADITGFNIIFVCAFKDPSGIDHLSRHLRRDYSDVIEEQNYLIIKEQVLFNLFPRGLVKQ
jgi:DNA-binding Lrp family transcriptional regulator